MHDLGATNVLRGVAAVAKGRMDLVRQIWEQSPYMQSRARNLDMDLRRALQGIDRRAFTILGKEISWQDVVDVGMMPLISVDMATSCAIWMAAYNREMSRLTEGPAPNPGMDTQSAHHQAPVAAADMAVKAVNPDFQASSRSQFLRSRGAVRLLNIFSSAVVLFAQRRAYNAAAFRQAWSSGQGSRAAAIGRYTRYEFYDFALQGVAMGLIMALAYGDDDPEKVGTRVATAWLDAAAMRVPMFNNIITGMITGDSWRGMSAVYQQPLEMAKRMRGAIDKGNDTALIWSLADMLSFTAKIPASRVARNAARGYDQWQHDEGTPLSVLMPRPGK